MSFTKRKDTEEAKAFWDHVEKTAAEVDKWPAWKKGAWCPK